MNGDRANMNDAAAADDDMLASRSNLVLQINRSHLERMVEFLNTHSANPKVRLRDMDK